MAVHSLLNHLLSRFREFKCHEEIENKYIVDELMPRLPNDAKMTLDNDIHSDNRLDWRRGDGGREGKEEGKGEGEGGRGGEGSRKGEEGGGGRGWEGGGGKKEM
jgi:uncharacterized membrane protein YgcG